MTRIKGITVTLLQKVETGRDPFDAPMYGIKKVPVKNVLVVPASTDDITNQLNLTGKKAVYALGIPKGDTNDWTNQEVCFFGETWRTIGIPQEGLEHLIPLDWNRKVMVERYE